MFNYTPVICLTTVHDGPKQESLHGYGFHYIQGAGDDEESWAHGLTPALFWQQKDFIMKSGPEGLHNRTAQVIQQAAVQQVNPEHCNGTLFFTTVGKTGLAIGTEKGGPTDGVPL